MTVVKSKARSKLKPKVKPALKTKVMNYWTTEEDKLVVDLFNDLILNQSCTLTEAKHKVAKKTNRTYDGVSYRYHKKFSHELDPNALLKIKENSLSNIIRKPENSLIDQSEVPQTDSNANHIDQISDSDKTTENEPIDFSLLPVYLNEYDEVQKQISDLMERSNKLLKEIKKYEDHLASLGSREQERRA